MGTFAISFHDHQTTRIVGNGNTFFDEYVKKYVSDFLYEKSYPLEILKNIYCHLTKETEIIFRTPDDELNDVLVAITLDGVVEVFKKIK